jgi:very-short-patch-repair endonuclease
MVKILNSVMKGWIGEFRFHPVRRWRFDYAHLKARIAIEVEGGAFSKGRHTRGTGFIKDMEKYNTAVIMGWRVLRYTPQQMRNCEFIKDIKAITEV